MGAISYPKDEYKISRDYAGTPVELTLNGKSFITSVGVKGNIQKVVNGVRISRQYLLVKANGYEFYPEVNKFPLVTRSKGLVECINTGKITYCDETEYVVCFMTNKRLLRSEAEMCNGTWVKKGWYRIFSAYHAFTTPSRYTEQAIDAFKKRYPTLRDFYKRIKEILGQHWDGDIANVPDDYHLHHNHKTGEVVNFWPRHLNHLEGNLKKFLTLDNSQHILDSTELLLTEALDEIRSNRKE